MFELATKGMNPRQAQEWFRREGRRQYDEYGGRGKDDLGPEMRLPVGKMRCHGIKRLQAAHGDWEDECVAYWYHQAHAFRNPPD